MTDVLSTCRLFVILQLPEDMSITWNSRLLKTAGFCAYKRNPAVGESRNARIELSVKVCDSAGQSCCTDSTTVNYLMEENI